MLEEIITEIKEAEETEDINFDIIGGFEHGDKIEINWIDGNEPDKGYCFGLPGLEAAACGIPVICSDIPVFREIYQNFPLYFPPKDHKTLANLILEYINDDYLKNQIIKNGLELIKKYSWKKSSEKYYKLAKCIVENN